jgi:integrase
MPRRTRHQGSAWHNEARNRWEGQVTIDGVRHKRTGRTRTELERKLAALRTAQPAERDASRTATVRTLLEQWLVLRMPERSVAPSTAEGHRWAVALWTSSLGGRKGVELRPAHIEAAMARLQAEHGLSRASLVKMRSTLNQAMRWHVGRGTMATNPVEYAAIPVAAPARRRERIALELDELAALFALLRDRPLEAMFMLSALAGLRPGEAAAVTRSAVDLDAGVVYVVRNVQRVNGRPVIADELKTARSRRALALPPELIDALRRRIDALKPSADDLLFPGANGGPMFSTVGARQLRSACKAAGVPVISPNELRHTFATHGSKRMSQRALADLMGHTTTRMLDEYYHHTATIIQGAEVMTGLLGDRHGLRAVG